MLLRANVIFLLIYTFCALLVPGFPVPPTAVAATAVVAPTAVPTVTEAVDDSPTAAVDCAIANHEPAATFPIADWVAAAQVPAITPITYIHRRKTGGRDKLISQDSRAVHKKTL